MSFEWPLNKLGVINASLAFTGDNQVATADDGSDEWNTCSPAYEDALAAITESHPWAWGKDTRQIQASPNPPDDREYQLAYVIPSDLVHLILVRVDDRPCIWDLQNAQLYIKAYGYGWTWNGDATPPGFAYNGAPGYVTIQGVFADNSDPTFATPLFVSALKRFVMAGIYRGLHEDTPTAVAMTAEAHQMLAAAKSRHDMQKPKRAMFNSRITASRRIRRPWPPVPGGWGGSGIPG